MDHTRHRYETLTVTLMDDHSPSHVDMQLENEQQG